MQELPLGHLDMSVVPVDLAPADHSGLVATTARRPRLGWRLESARQGVRQLAFEIERSPCADFAEPVASTGWIASSSPLGADWPGEDLASREVSWSRVRLCTDLGVTCWSSPVRIETALLEASDWTARPISPIANVALAGAGPVPLVRRSFTIENKVASARLYVSALGIQECWINGRRVSPDLFEPGWTAYRQRTFYATYDVSDLLGAGENVIAAAIGDGWWRGHLTWTSQRAVYGDTTAFLAQLELIYADGTRETVATDDTWKGATGGLVEADFYNGCTIDISREPAGWRESGFDDSGWDAVVSLPLPAGLEQRSLPPVREVASFDAAWNARADGSLTIDCKQNLTGYLRLHISAANPGAATVRHAEILESDGSLHTAALRTARATDEYRVPAGSFVLSPSFTYHGFRYAEIRLSDGLAVDRVEVCVVATDLPDIGHFRCSNELLNQLASNIRWSQRGNFISIPTDCPQRDERLGWTGDIQVFAPTACTNFQSQSFLKSWLVDLAFEQADDGRVPSVVPNVIQGHPYEYAGIGWADAATLVPWALYEAYGDTEVLTRQFPSMKAWVDWSASRLSVGDVWLGDFHLGDWLDPGAPPERPEEATTDRDFIASAYLSYSAGVLARTASILGREDLARQYADLSRQVAEGTWRRWSKAALLTQTGCAIAISFDIAPRTDQISIGESLAGLIRASSGRIATGFLGTPLVLPALTRTGQHDVAYELLLNEKAPGWLYQVLHGATTMWERWDAIQPDGSIHRGDMAAEDAESMTSFNHYAYGSVGAWMYRTLAGIAPDISLPGYQHIIFAPVPGGDLTWAEASLETPFGRAAIAWDKGVDELLVDLAIPPGAVGTFKSPPGWKLSDGVSPLALTSGQRALRLRRE